LVSIVWVEQATNGDRKSAITKEKMMFFKNFT